MIRITITLSAALISIITSSSDRTSPDNVHHDEDEDDGHHCDYRTQVSLGSDLWVLMSLHPRLCADLTDVTLADEDSNSTQS